MKSAYELAMERLGGTHEYTDEQRDRLAEIDRRHDAKKAEATLAADRDRESAAGDAARLDEIQAELARDLPRIEENRESDKAVVRREAGLEDN
jgi:hypothetical protein